MSRCAVTVTARAEPHPARSPQNHTLGAPKAFVCSLVPVECLGSTSAGGPRKSGEEKSRADAEEMRPVGPRSLRQYSG